MAVPRAPGLVGVSTLDDPSPSSSPAEPEGLPTTGSISLLFVGVLYLCSTSRWGSYVAPPGLPIYVGDVFLAAGTAQAVVVVRSRVRARAVVHAVVGAPLFLLLTLTFLCWSLIRAVLGVGGMWAEPLTALRDLAPYGYSVAALVAFVLPTADRTRARQLVYAALTIHFLWVQGAGYLPGWPQHWPLLGGAAIFTSRPDFDAAVFGVATALALHQLLQERPRSWWATTALAAFAILNGAALLASPTRAGLLAGLLVSGVVISTLLLRRTVTPRRLPGRVRGVALVVLLALFLALIALSPPGKRLVESLSGAPTTAAGTINARELAWRAVDGYVLADASRTAVGVGFGPDFLTDSGATYLLEGELYNDVRSPHNYLIGSFARMGVAGLLLAGMLLASAGLAAVKALAGPVGVPTALAALLVLAIPVTALLGVVLEAPFGAIPYFWAVGQLARHIWSARGDATGPQDSLTRNQR